MDIDVFIYTVGVALMALIYMGFLVWAIKTGQFKDNDHLRFKPLENEEEEMEYD